MTLARVRKAIVDNCELVLASDAFEKWKGSGSSQDGDLIVVNNSFLYRGDGRAKLTTKSSLYLAVEVTAGSNFSHLPVVLSAKNGIDVRFKRIPSKQRGDCRITDLDTALSDQLRCLGSIVFSLIGRIGEVDQAEVKVSKVPGLEVLRYAPDQATPGTLVDGVLSLTEIDDLDIAWSAAQEAALVADINLAKLGDEFDGLFRSLQEAATRSVDLTDLSDDGPSILASIQERMELQTADFSSCLESYRAKPTDIESYNELLRIAYNFAEGARAFLALVVGVCDLKPVIFWSTAFEQVELADCLEDLPFSLVGKGKPSLESYRSVIAGARNQAFHDLFAFDHPFRVRLADDALRSPELRIFREYGRKKDPALTFDDQGLVELFKTLTRTPERPVPVGFWDGNGRVMSAVIEVVRALRRTLHELAPQSPTASAHR
jgi:hypothetical protein